MDTDTELDLTVLLDRADAADPSDRITWRDPIAAHNAEAITVMAAWLKDGKHTGFAIRTLERIGESDDPLLAALAVRTLRSVQPSLDQSDRELVKRSLLRLGEPEKPTEAEPDYRLYDRLIESAREGKMPAYSVVAEPAGLTMRLSRDRRVIGQMLGNISRREVGAGRPMLSSIVAHKGGSDVGSGFYQLGEELDQVLAGEAEEVFWERQQRETLDFWASHPDAGPIE
jgi:hypothetical protein